MIAPRSALPRRSPRYCPIPRSGVAKSVPSLELDSIMALDTLPSARAAALVLEAARSGRPPHRTTTAVS